MGEDCTPEAAHDSVLVTALQLAAPYLAVLIFWVGLENAWLAILAYHSQIVFWLWRRSPRPPRPQVTRTLAFALPSALAGPVVYVLLPRISSVDVASWLPRYGLSGASLLVMVAYFGLVHPPLEQLYWNELRKRTPLAHALFAGYHVIVLASLLQAPWLAACFFVLFSASVMWQYMAGHRGGILAAVASHALADAGIVVAAYLLVTASV